MRVCARCSATVCNNLDVTALSPRWHAAQTCGPSACTRASSSLRWRSLQRPLRASTAWCVQGSAVPGRSVTTRGRSRARRECRCEPRAALPPPPPSPHHTHRLPAARAPTPFLSPHTRLRWAFCSAPSLAHPRLALWAQSTIPCSGPVAMPPVHCHCCYCHCCYCHCRHCHCRCHHPQPSCHQAAWPLAAAGRRAGCAAG